MTSRAEAIVDQLVDAGVTVTAGLPDSWLAPVLDRLATTPSITHVAVTREDDGAAVCAGAALGGSVAALVCQNAGLLLAGNGLAAYAMHHQLPFVVLAAHRGGAEDRFYYQAYKGAVVGPVLDAIGLPVHELDGPDDDHVIGDAVIQASMHRRPVVVLCSKRGLLGESDR